MPGDNFSRRVARAAASGGGRTYRAQTPVTWYLVLLVICLLGVSLVAYSRYELIHPPAAVPKPVVPPTASNEWQAAVAVDVCGKFVPSALPIDQVASDPLASIGNGVVRIDPSLSLQPALYEGKGATLGAYLLIEGASISGSLLQLPGKPVPVPTTTSTSSSTTTTTTLAKAKKGTTTTSPSTTTTTTVLTKPGPAHNYRSGVTKCGSKPGYAVVETWPSPTSTKGTAVPSGLASGIRFENGQLITIAFLRKGEAVPRPPAADRRAVSTFLLEDPSGVATTTLPASTVPVTTVPVTTVPASTSKSSSKTSSTT